jgi:hypothetical protein
MARYDWFSIGLKLMGVYFGVNGVAGLWSWLLAFVGSSAQSGKVEGVGVVGFLLPAVYLAAAYLMVCKTPICLRWCGEGAQPGITSPPPAM